MVLLCLAMPAAPRPAVVMRRPWWHVGGAGGPLRSVGRVLTHGARWGEAEGLGGGPVGTGVALSRCGGRRSSMRTSGRSSDADGRARWMVEKEWSFVVSALAGDGASRPPPELRQLVLPRRFRGARLVEMVRRRDVCRTRRRGTLFQARLYAGHEGPTLSQISCVFAKPTAAARDQSLDNYLRASPFRFPRRPSLRLPSTQISAYFADAALELTHVRAKIGLCGRLTFVDQLCAQARDDFSM